MIETAVFWGADRSAAEKEMEAVLDFEMDLLQILKDPSHRGRNISKIYNECNVSGLYEMNPNMNWKEYIETIYPYNIQDSEPVVVTLGQNFTKNFTKLYEETDIRILANYAIGRMVRSLTPFVSEEFGELHFEIFKKMSGVQQRATRWKRCMAQTKDYFATAIGSMYVQKFFKPEAKKMAIEMVDFIRTEMRDIINKVTWADNQTIERAKEKLDAVTAHVAYPEELLDDKKLFEVYEDYNISALNFFANMRHISRLDTIEYKEKLRKPVKRNFWEYKSNVAIVNAFYNSLDNSISIPAGILQDVFFDFDRPQYMNFAAIGTVVGHELTHGFDNTGLIDTIDSLRFLVRE
uniref:Peptidase M13 N-terminal domain-containing protein n=1 Tax=Strigamia maritima TaxID=126957 RepID=T1J6V7_STRMM